MEIDKVYGVIYNKTPQGCLDFWRRMNVPASDYIFLHLDESREEWLRKLKGKKIDLTRVYGIDCDNLEEYNVIIVNKVDKFSIQEVFYILHQRFRYPEKTLEDIFIELGRSVSTPTYFQFNKDRNNYIKQIKAQLFEGRNNDGKSG